MTSEELFKSGNTSFPVVSVIILNYNGKEYLETCLNSVLNSAYSNFEVIFVDNGSSDGSVDFVKEKFACYPCLRIVINSENLGFAEGNNVGAQHAKSDLLVFLNNDTKVYPNWLGELVKTAISNPSVGICLCRIICDNSQENLLGNVDRYGRAALMHFEDVIKRGRDVIASGPAFLIRRDVFNIIGGFDCRYVLYFEDIDLAWRVKLLGYRILIEPKAIVFHEVAGTIRRVGLSRRRYLVYRNTLRTLIKNYSVPTLWRVLPISFMLIFLESVALVYMIKDPFVFLTAFKALLWNLMNFKDTWIFHQYIQSTRVISDDEIHQIMAPFSFLRRIP